MAAATPRHSNQAPASNPPDSQDVYNITRIMLRPIGSPVPLGLFTVAIASAVVSAFDLQIIPIEHQRAVALVIAPAFVLQFVAALFAFLGRDAISATLLASFSSTWLVSALIFLLNPPGGNRVLGIYYFIFVIFLLLILSLGKSKLVLTVIMISAIPRFISSGVFELTESVVTGYIAGVFGVVLTIISLYGAYALLAEDVSGQSPLPIGRRGKASVALQGPITDQLEGLEHNAGVRRTL